MPAKRYPMFEFNQRKQREHWNRIDQFNGDFQAFSNFVKDPTNADHKQFGPYAMAQVTEFYPEVEREVGPGPARPGSFMIFLDQGPGQNFVSLSRRSDDFYLVWSCWESEETAMSVRRTKGIVTDSSSSDPGKEADVIMMAAVLGLAADYIAATKKPLQFDMDPLEASSPQEQTKTALFNTTVLKMDAAVAAYLTRKKLAPNHLHAGLSPGYWQGAMIMGVYVLAGQETPQPEHPGTIASPLTAPVLSVKGKALWDKIRTVSPMTPQYTGRGAYTGFVDNKNTVGNTDPVGPRSTVRMVAPAPGDEASTVVPYPRWLPPGDHPVWNPRERKGTNTYVPWGLIGGDKATQDPTSTNDSHATNLAEQIELEMRDKYGMVFASDPTMNDIATYTHGMIQAIYKAYALGPSCAPYEIAVGDQTKKMASCLPCTLFMHAAGYPPSSIHLGSGESWAPLYAPYNPNGCTESNEFGVIRDLNNAWYDKCLAWLKTGLEILDDAHITADNKASRDAVLDYLKTHEAEPTLGGVLILDALTLHDSELNRISRTLQ